MESYTVENDSKKFLSKKYEIPVILYLQSYLFINSERN